MLMTMGNVWQTRNLLHGKAACRCFVDERVKYKNNKKNQNRNENNSNNDNNSSNENGQQ